MEMVSIIIVNYNLTRSIRILLKSIEENVKNINYEVIVVDNNSTDRNIEKLSEEFPRIRFLYLETNYGFGHGNNSGVKISQGKYLLMLNPDTYLINNLPLLLYKFAKEHPDIGIIGPKLVFPDGSMQVSYAKFPNIKQELFYAIGLIGIALKSLYEIKDFVYKKSYYLVDFVFGSCVFIRKDVFQKVNGFDEAYFLFLEETDLCYRVKHDAGLKVVYWKGASIVHEKSLITGKNIPARIKQNYISKLIFFSKNYSPFRRYILKKIVIGVFLFKHLTLFRKGKAKQKFKEVYRAIIKLYLR